MWTARAGLSLLTVLSVVPPARPEALPGVVVEDVDEGSPAGRAGLRPGDVLLRWEQRAEAPAGAASGELASPLDLEHVEREQGPRGPLTLEGSRDGAPLRVVLTLGGWAVRPGRWESGDRLMGSDRFGLETRPQLGEADLAAYERARALIIAGSTGAAIEEGLSLWGDLARRLVVADRFAATWLFLRIGRAAARAERWPPAAAAFEAALEGAEALGSPHVRALAKGAAGRFWEERGDWARARDAYEGAIEAHRALAGRSLGEAWGQSQLFILAAKRGDLAAKRGDLAAASDHLRRAREIYAALAPRSLTAAGCLFNAGRLAQMRGDLDTAEALTRQALALQEDLAPESVPTAGTFVGLGNIALERGDLASAEGEYRRGQAIVERLAPNSVLLSKALVNLGITASERGDLASAEDHYRRALGILEAQSPLNPDLVVLRINLGDLAETRADLATAEDHFRRALALQQQLGLKGTDLAFTLGRLGNVARHRNDLPAAAALYRKALEIWEGLAPGSPSVASGLAALARVALARGQPRQARRDLERAADIEARLAPRGPLAAETSLLLGDAVLAEGDRPGAQAHYERALAILREQAPGSVSEAEACHRLARLHRHRRPERALEYYRCAMDALDAQRLTLGGSHEVAARFAARHTAYYREALDLLVEQGRPEEAFQVLERYRARGLLTLLAERDLVFSADIPADLDRERRQANAEYDRIQAEMREAEGAAGDEKRAALRRLRERQAAIRTRIRALSPRLSTLHYPEPLDLAAIRRVLDPGTLLLSYSVGDQASHLFAVGPGPDDFLAAPIATTRGRLQEQVGYFREALQRQRRRPRLLFLARGLSRTLLGPVADRIVRAERLLIIPDGPLHLLPFSALLDPAAPRPRYLVEAKPLHLAASATVFAQIQKDRRPPRAPRLVAFGDPDYSAARTAGAAASPPELRLATERGLNLRPAPATRTEVEDLHALYTAESRTYLGAEATEENAKAVGHEASLIHFACHGLWDGRSPLDSALALSIPRAWHAGQDNGLLQAWEVLEQVRIDADLVTLSACGTGLGEELSGEGVLGLTRAFQYAGARSVLASLWAVHDAATAGLMSSFYRHLRDGASKDAALQAAQVEMIRDGTHPFRWAAFQLVGDWR